MLQNQCKGMIFYPNNQKKRHKKHKSATFFDLGWVYDTTHIYMACIVNQGILKYFVQYDGVFNTIEQTVFIEQNQFLQTRKMECY